MTPRERIIRTVEFSGPDKMPVHRSVFPGALQRHGQKLADLLNGIPDDFSPAKVEVPPPPKKDAPPMESYRDEWGCLWLRRQGYTAGEVKEPPLPTWDHFKNYQFPELPTFEGVEKFIRETDHRWYVFGYSWNLNLFERLQFVRGTENLFMDLAEDREEVHVLADRIVQYYTDGIKRCLGTGADGYYFSDDWGAQTSMLISPEKWRTFFKPRYRGMFDVVKNAGAHVWFHTDGWITEILDDLIEIGVDVLNPQHHIMGNELVAERIAGRICLRSDLDRQHIIPHGSPDEIEAHVKDIIRLFGDFNGGLVLHGEVGPEVPFENIEAMHRAFERYGRYPLDWLARES